jgi:hypothetical protein
MKSPNIRVDATVRIKAPSAGFAQKVDPIWNEPVNTGNAGALARYEREARNSYSVKKFQIERAAHAVLARALPVLACLFLPHHFLGKTPSAAASKLRIPQSPSYLGEDALIPVPSLQNPLLSEAR